MLLSIFWNKVWKHIRILCTLFLSLIHKDSHSTSLPGHALPLQFAVLAYCHLYKSRGHRFTKFPLECCRAAEKKIFPSSLSPSRLQVIVILPSPTSRSVLWSTSTSTGAHQVFPAHWASRGRRVAVCSRRYTASRTNQKVIFRSPPSLIPLPAR